MAFTTPKYLHRVTWVAICVKNRENMDKVKRWDISTMQVGEHVIYYLQLRLKTLASTRTTPSPEPSCP